TSAAPLSTMPSAESYVQELLRKQNAAGQGVGGGASTLPGAAGGTGAGGGASAAGGAMFEMNGNLIRENQLVTQRSGKLGKDSAGRIVFMFDGGAKPELPAMAVVPSRRLAALEDATEHGSKG